VSSSSRLAQIYALELQIRLKYFLLETKTVQSKAGSGMFLRNADNNFQDYAIS